MRTALASLVCLLLLAFTSQQDSRPDSAFLTAPLAGSLALSGTFGELRPGHFHAGIDLKGPVGEPVLAAAQGYIERIGINAGGYGKVLYLRHPNGSTTVYAHLDRFRPEVEDWVKGMQYARESYELDLYPERGRFAYQQGETLGFIGMSGRSFGPHLHFELRRGEQAFNPLRAGIAAADHRPPVLLALRLHELRDNQTEFNRWHFNLRKAGRAYRLPNSDTLYTDAPYAAFSLLTFDQADGAENRNGIYRLELWVNDTLSFKFHLDSLLLWQSRYFNAHVDYAAQIEDGQLFNRCWQLPGNAADIYASGGGGLALAAGGATKLRFVAFDLAGNSTFLECWLKARLAAAALPPAPLYHYLLPFNEASILSEPSLKAHFPAGSFYEDLHLHYQAVAEESYNIYSLVHQLHDLRVPVHHAFQLGIRPTRAIPEPLLSKAFIAYCDKSHRTINCGGQWKDGWLYAQTNALGDYYIMLDTVPPRIEPLRFREDMRGENRFAFRITDNFPSGANTPELRYRGTIDGRWALFSFDQKNSRLECRLEDSLASGRHQLRLEVWDALGNMTVFEQAFMK
jgi:hypothetical protein